MTPKNRELTKNKSKFIDEYIKTLDPVQSVIKAGYPENLANFWAQKLLSDKQILSAINDKILQMSRTLQVSKAYFTKKLLEIIDETTRREEVLDRSGNPTGKTKLKDASVALRALCALASQSDKTGENSAHTSDLKILCIENLDENKI